MTMPLVGLHRAICADNADPEEKNRLMLIIPSITGEVPVGWVFGCTPPGWSGPLPQPGDGVWVMFENGDPQFPVWVGVF